MTIPNKAGLNAEIDISESGRRYIILRYRGIFIAKLIEEMYTEEVLDAIAAAYTARNLSEPTSAVQKAAIAIAEEYRNPGLNQLGGENRRVAAGIGDHTYTERKEEGTTEIPRRAELKLPMLELLAQGPMENSDIVDAIAELYDLTEEERTRVINSNFSIFEREVWGAKHLLREDHLIDYPTRGESPRPTSITARGLRVSGGKFLAPYAPNWTKASLVQPPVRLWRVLGKIEHRRLVICGTETQPGLQIIGMRRPYRRHDADPSMKALYPPARAQISQRIRS